MEAVAGELVTAGASLQQAASSRRRCRHLRPRRAHSNRSSSTTDVSSCRPEPLVAACES